MSKSELMAELPKLSHAERREIMRALVEMESEQAILADCDRRAVESFQMLDVLEAEDEKNASR